MNDKLVPLVLSGVLAALAVTGIHYDEICAYKKNGEREKTVVKNPAFKKWYQILCAVLLILLGMAFAIWYEQYTTIYVWKRMFLMAGLLIAAYYDKIYLRIPNFLIIALLIGRVVLIFAELAFQRETMVSTIISEVLAAAAMGSLCLICSVLMKGAIGMGDVKLLMVMGIFEGLTGIFSAVSVSLIFTFFAAVFCLVTRKKGRKDALPFAPFLMAGTYFSILFTGC